MGNSHNCLRVRRSCTRRDVSTVTVTNENADSISSKELAQYEQAANPPQQESSDAQQSNGADMVHRRGNKVLGLRRAFRRMKRAGLGHSEIHNNIRNTYLMFRESPEAKASLQNNDSVRNMALKNLSHTLETNRNTETSYRLDDTTSSKNDSPTLQRTQLSMDPVRTSVHPGTSLGLSFVSVADEPLSSGRPPKPSSPENTRHRSRPNLKVVISDEMVSDANLGSPPVLGACQTNTPREDARISPGGGLHIGNFAIKEAGIEVSSTAGNSKVPHTFLLGGKSDFVQIGKLGTGSSGNVVEALHLRTLTIVALKMIPINDSDNIHHISSELGVLYQNLAELHLLSSSLDEELKCCDEGSAVFTGKSIIQTLTPRSVYSDTTSQYTPCARQLNSSKDCGSVTSNGCQNYDGHSEAGSETLSDIDMEIMSDVSRSDTSRAKRTKRKNSKVTSCCAQLLAMYDAFLDPTCGIVNLVVEYMDGGSLQDVVDNGGCRDEEVLADIAYQVLLGLDFLHSRNLAHRDIKPGNILLNCEGVVKLADFGIAKVLQKTPKGEHIASNSFVGTMCYMAPERIRNEQYGFPGDIWSFGMSILAVVRGGLPLSTCNGSEPKGYWDLLKSICDEDIELPGENYTEELNLFIGACLHKSPESRPLVKDLLQHLFFQRNSNVLYCSEDDNSTSSNVFTDAIFALQSVDDDDDENESLPRACQPKLKTTRSLPTRSTTFQNSVTNSSGKSIGGLKVESHAAIGNGSSSLSRLTTWTATQRSTSLGRVAWNNAPFVGKAASYSLDDHEVSDVSTVSETSAMSEENINITAVRLEHLERVLNLVQLKYDKSLRAACKRDHSLDIAVPEIDSLNDLNGVYQNIGSGRSLSPLSALGCIRKLPNFKDGLKHWRHLAQQMHLPLGVVESAARNIINASFFDDELLHQKK